MAQIAGSVPDPAFVSLGRGDTAKLARALRPLAWIDGLLTASVLSPEVLESELWLEHTCSDEALGSLTFSEMESFVSTLDARQDDIAAALMDHPEFYRPFLGGADDRMAAAAEWAAGFRFGIGLQPEPWRCLIEDDEARQYLALIFCLERDESLPEGDSPFADVTPERREEMRRVSLEHLPAAILALNAFSDFLPDHGDEDVFGTPLTPYQRTTPKIGRNEPCPCGSGKKHKKCCLEQEDPERNRS